MQVRSRFRSMINVSIESGWSVTNQKGGSGSDRSRPHSIRPSMRLSAASPNASRAISVVTIATPRLGSSFAAPICSCSTLLSFTAQDCCVGPPCG